jgi:hypothetical protein
VEEGCAGCARPEGGATGGTAPTSHARVPIRPCIGGKRGEITSVRVTNPPRRPRSLRVAALRRRGPMRLGSLLHRLAPLLVLFGLAAALGGCVAYPGGYYGYGYGYPYTPYYGYPATATVGLGWGWGGWYHGGDWDHGWHGDGGWHGGDGGHGGGGWHH